MPLLIVKSHVYHEKLRKKEKTLNIEPIYLCFEQLCKAVGQLCFATDLLIGQKITFPQRKQRGAAKRRGCRKFDMCISCQPRVLMELSEISSLAF